MNALLKIWTVEVLAKDGYEVLLGVSTRREDEWMNT